MLHAHRCCSHGSSCWCSSSGRSSWGQWPTPSSSANRVSGLLLLKSRKYLQGTDYIALMPAGCAIKPTSVQHQLQSLFKHTSSAQHVCLQHDRTEPLSAASADATHLPTGPSIGVKGSVSPQATNIGQLTLGTRSQGLGPAGPEAAAAAAAAAAGAQHHCSIHQVCNK
jgi:hypothetical protein